MSSDSPYEVEDVTYGELLGAYFEVAAEISGLLDDFGRPRPEERSRYEELRARKREIRAALDDVEDDQTATNIRTILDRALSSD